MKIIHTADLHLDSPLSGVKDPSLRRAELLRALKRLSDYVDNRSVAAVIVAGDLFDDKFVKRQTIANVAEIIGGSRAKWFVLRGNHGDSSAYESLRELCPDVCFFGDEWTLYSQDNVVICGRELGTRDEERWNELQLDRTKFNVLVLHGDVDDDSYGYVNRKAIASSGASYVALGHRHSYSAFKFGSVKAAYSGVLESRGFDEKEQTGFIEIDTDNGTVKFVPQSIRRVENVALDVTGIETEVDLEGKILDSVSGVNTSNYLNFTLCGKLCRGVRAEFTAKQVVSDRFFAVRIQDDTTADVDLDSIRDEISLRGEFVKLAMTIENERERQAVLKMGLAVLNGEEF
ncbi:MAG: DNA repair exonuclease [Corallococcus sp.]|nr:DNA repair exonuclease [Corallococcus sp.]